MVINIDSLKKEIERLGEIDYPYSYNQCVGFYDALDRMESFVNSLQQKQPKVELDDDIEMEWDSFNKHLAEYGVESEEVVWLNWNSFNDVACHFYELGLKERKEE